LSNYNYEKPADGGIHSRTTSKESRLPETLSTFDAPELTDAEIASIDEAGAKEHHRLFVRRTFVRDAGLSVDMIPV
jgi:hypothetical protein